MMWLCEIGFHKWGPYKNYMDVAQIRTCARCGKEQVKSKI